MHENVCSLNICCCTRTGGSRRAVKNLSCSEQWVSAGEQNKRWPKVLTLLQYYHCSISVGVRAQELMSWKKVFSGSFCMTAMTCEKEHLFLLESRYSAQHFCVSSCWLDETKRLCGCVTPQFWLWNVLSVLGSISNVSQQSVLKFPCKSSLFSR